MGLNRNPGCNLPDKDNKENSISLGSLNPFTTEADNILVSKCCRADALYRISDKYGYDIWEFCPQCLELCDWDEIKEDGNLGQKTEDLLKSPPMEYGNKHLFDEMAEYYGEHGLPAKVNEKTLNDQKNLPKYEDVLKLLDDDGFYDGELDDLLPWTFSLSDFQHPDREIELLVKLWNGELEGVISGTIAWSNKGEGYIYYFEADALIYEVVISENMGLDSFSIVAEGEQ